MTPQIFRFFLLPNTLVASQLTPSLVNNYLNHAVGFTLNFATSFAQIVEGTCVYNFFDSLLYNYSIRGFFCCFRSRYIKTVCGIHCELHMSKCVS